MDWRSLTVGNPSYSNLDTKTLGKSWTVPQGDMSGSFDVNTNIKGFLIVYILSVHYTGYSLSVVSERCMLALISYWTRLDCRVWKLYTLTA